MKKETREEKRFIKCTREFTKRDNFKSENTTSRQTGRGQRGCFGFNRKDAKVS
jgi:hypothetical protein